jgi:hypothetical protein
MSSDDRFAARFRAWPLAWSSPSGPLGWQRSPALTQGRVLKIVSAKRLETIFGCP